MIVEESLRLLILRRYHEWQEKIKESEGKDRDK